MPGAGAHRNDNSVAGSDHLHKRRRCAFLQLRTTISLNCRPDALYRQALHAVRCAGDDVAPCGGVSLHLYAPPIKRTRLYETDEDRVTLRVPGFFSAAGVPLSGGDAKAAGPAAAAPWMSG